MCGGLDLNVWQAGNSQHQDPKQVQSKSLLPFLGRPTIAGQGRAYNAGIDRGGSIAVAPDESWRAD